MKRHVEFKVTGYPKFSSYIVKSVAENTGLNLCKGFFFRTRVRSQQDQHRRDSRESKLRMTGGIQS